MRVTSLVLIVVAMLGAGPGMTAATSPGLPPLREVAEIRDGLLAVGIAAEIRDNCDSISARMLTALHYLNSLENRAKELGYSPEEIEDYVTSKAEKRAMRDLGEAYLAANGVSRDNPESFCILGRAEIEKGSQIGALLRAR